MSAVEHYIYLALGSNLGDRLENLQTAIANLPPKVVPLACSPIYETEPWGYREQPAFLNQVMRAATALSPTALLDYLKKLERKMGRQETVKYGPRVIDLDILFYDDLVLHTPTLTIPHPRMQGRAFVLVPLAGLAGDMRHPGMGIPIREMLAETGAAGVEWFAPGSCGADKT